MVAEGGALEVDGEGALLLTQHSMLGPTRNPGATRDSLAAELGALLGATRVVWLDAMLEGDDTDGHIDTIARFVQRGVVTCAREPRAEDRNHEPLERARDTLVRAGFDVRDLPMPEPLWAEGANFYIANAGVLVPTFGVPSDARALSALAPLFPDRRLFPVPCRALVRGLGAVHCLTQPQPA